MKIRIAKRDPKKRVASTDLCNGRRANGELCRRPAGYRTDHLGVGRCARHGGNAGKRLMTHGWYVSIQHRRLKDLLTQIANVEANAMNLIPEANLLRAMTVDYVNRYEEFSEALMAWYADPENKARPRRIMDIQDAAHLIESISRVVQRLHQIQSQGAISLETFQRVTEQMGMMVARHVKDPRVLVRIEEDWMSLALDTKTVHAPPPGQGDT